MVRRTKEDAEVTRRQIVEAARRVFLECGVGRTSLEKVALAAGVTRGAVYWHFKNKSDLFFAMREEATLPFLDRVIFDEEDDDPLGGIERALQEIIRVLVDQPQTRETLDIVTFKCEYVDEFSGMMNCTSGQFHFLQQLIDAYGRAALKNQLRAGVDPEALAYDTFLFVSGLVRNWLASPPVERLHAGAEDFIRTHMALRRR
ncbi:MAG: TetR family transcriptional regulator [Zoogloea sp.]|jgi:TetR/AcrR family acrAB operon transcriptional repressor|uniref:TetR family transcriptional regulator n=1 Tax=Zoogloea sp. TaxID=49181 RepID=UPI001B775684|nr:TetR family transcriptional regulator [Zoogloea sp.]MBP8265629.1 TetR family transcriptional regulator [Zoogloea sp.]HQA10069.1 TetR family transcriptional regulator [Zoogloea sp.]HQE39082.1 TetR family transcriptional regulator [Zoogloea sp.]